MFFDTITLYNKITATDPDTQEEATSWKRTVVEGVQWSDQYEKENNSGRISVARYSNITFPKGTFEDLVLDPSNEEDLIVYGVCTEEITGEKGSRVSDVMKRHIDCGLIKTVNRNDNRLFLKNVKVVVAK